MTTPPPVPICRPCIAERNRWMDTKPSQMFREFGIAHGSGAPHDVSIAGLRDRSRARHERWRRLVNFQLDLIARRCRAAGHTAVPQPPRLVQLPIFDLLEAA